MSCGPSRDREHICRGYGRSVSQNRVNPARAMPTWKSASVALGILLLAPLALTACQTESAINREPRTGATTAAAEAGVQQVTITTDDKFRFTPAQITVHPGRVRITLKHLGSGGAPHDWSLNGFPADYIIDRTADGRAISGTRAVRMVGNSVSPPPLAAIARANLDAACVETRAAA